MKMTLKMKLLSIALALIMVFVSYIAIPAKALAEDAEEAAQAEAIEAYADANDFSQDNALEYSPLIGELSEGRDESIKVFRRADGAKEAVIYSDPIHYLNGEVWEPIDNTLELVTLENGTQVYRNKANDTDKVSNGISSLLTMIEGAFAKDRVLQILRDFIFYPDDSKLAQCEVFYQLSDEANAFLSTKWEDLMKEFTEKTR